MRTYLLILLSFISIDSNAQSVRGRITSGGSPLPGVIVIADSAGGNTSNANGDYFFNLSPGIHSLQFRMISFETEMRTIQLVAGDTLRLDISMKEKANELGIVVVSAGKFEQHLENVTVSMDVLKPALVQERNAVSVDEAMDNVPGVNIIDGQANIRGGSGWSYGAGSRVQILVDDLPQLTADAGDAKWNFLPVENLEQIEVVKGASSVLFGSSALNGAINIRTAYPRDTPSTKINIYSGLYDKAYITTDKKYSLQFSDSRFGYYDLNFFHSRKIKRFDLVAGGNFFRDEGYRQGENENRGRLNLNTRYNFKTPGLAAGINFNSMINDETIFFLWKNDTSGAYLPAANTLSESKTYRTNIDPYITYTNAKGFSHKLRTRWFNSTNKNNTDQNSTSNLYYSEYQFQKHSEYFTVSAGLVNIISKVNSELYGDHTGYQHAGYVQADGSIGKFNLSAGGRAEQNKIDKFSDKWTPVFRTGVNFHAFKGTYFRVSAGQGYRFPSIAEKFISTTVGGAKIFPNPEVGAEKGVSLEGGVRQLFHAAKVDGYIDAAVFENDYHSMIEFVFAKWGNTNDFFNDNGFKSVNVGNTRIRGLEISALAIINLSGEAKISVQGGYTYLDPRQITYDSAYIKKIGPDNVKGSDSTNFLKYRYKHLVRGDVEVSVKKFSAGFSVRYNSRMENIDKIFTSGFLDILIPPGLGIADYRLHRKHGDLVCDGRFAYAATKSLKISFIVKNMFNYIYMQRPADMQPPRTFVVMAGVAF